MKQAIYKVNCIMYTCTFISYHEDQLYKHLVRFRNITSYKLSKHAYIPFISPDYKRIRNNIIKGFKTNLL